MQSAISDAIDKKVVGLMKNYFIKSGAEFSKICELAAAARLASIFPKAGHPVRYAGLINPGEVSPVIALGGNGAVVIVPMMWNATCMCLDNVGNTLYFSGNLNRCVVPVSYYDVNEMYKKSTDEPITWLASVYTRVNNLPMFSILSSNGDPIMLKGGDVRKWIRDDADTQAILDRSFSYIVVDYMGKANEAVLPILKEQAQAA